jgi:hypothetical protein
MGRVVLRRKTDGQVFANIPQLAKRPEFEEIDFDEWFKNKDKPKATKKKAAPKRRKPAEQPLVAETADEIDDLIAGITDGETDDK